LAGTDSFDFPDLANVHPQALNSFTQNIHARNLNYWAASGCKALGAVSAYAATTPLRTPSRIHHIFFDLSPNDAASVYLMKMAAAWDRRSAEEDCPHVQVGCIAHDMARALAGMEPSTPIDERLL
jgi:hypothetical protein